MITAEQNFNLKYQVSEQDFVKAYELASLKRSQTPFNSYVIMPALGGVLIAFALLLSMRGLQSGVGLCFVLGATPLVVFQLIRARVLTTYRAAVDHHDPRGLEASRQGLRLWSVASNKATNWSEFASFAEDTNNFVLMQDAELEFVPVPKRSMTPVEINSFRSLLEEKLPRM